MFANHSEEKFIEAEVKILYNHLFHNWRPGGSFHK